MFPPRIALQRAFTRLEITNIKIPIFQKVVKLPSGGYEIQIKLLSGSSYTSFEKKREKLEVALKAEKVTFKKIRSNVVQISVIKSFPKSFPQSPLNQLSLFPDNRMSIPVGLDSKGEVFELPLWNDSGGTVTLIGGNPGFGKSSALQVIVSGLMEGSSAIFWIDLKGASDAGKFRGRVEAVSDPTDTQGALNILNNLMALIQRRNQLIGRGIDIRALSPVLLIIDEWSLLGMDAKGSKADIDKTLRAIASTGRSAYVSLVLATQRPTSTNIDVATRELASNRIAFSVGDEHASIAILGRKGAEMTAAQMPPGTAIISLNGQEFRVNFYGVADDLSARVVGTSGLIKSFSDLDFELDTLEREHKLQKSAGNP